MDPISNLSRAFDVAHGVFLGVTPDKWSAQSPCSEWDARGVKTGTSNNNVAEMENLLHATIELLLAESFVK